MFRRKHNTHDIEEENINKEEKVNELRTAIGPLSGRKAQFCTDACLMRYLEARNWNLDKSKKMLEETLMWRSTYKPEDICWNEISAEGETGKMYRAHFCDREGRTVLVMKPGKENTTSHDNQLQFLVYLLENVILNLPEGQEQMVWLIDFSGWSLSKAVPIKVARETAHILQCHYPERLYSASLYNPPRIFEAFWKVVRYFLDPKTFQKVKFVYPKNKESMALLEKSFDLKVLPVEFGGSNDYEYNHVEYGHLMEKDDIKRQSLWAPDKVHPTDGHCSDGVPPEVVVNGSAAN